MLQNCQPNDIDEERDDLLARVVPPEAVGRHSGPPCRPSAGNDGVRTYLPTNSRLDPLDEHAPALEADSVGA